MVSDPDREALEFDIIRAATRRRRRSSDAQDRRVRALLERVLDLGEGRIELGADTLDDCDDGH
jgi:hypothetical protein